MRLNKNYQYIKETLDVANKIGIVCSAKGSDSVAAGIALMSYICDRWDKKVDVIYTGDFSDINPELLNLHEVKSDFLSRTLKVTLDYGDTNIQTIDYYKEDDSKLVLDIKPIGSNFDTNRIRYDLNGASYDLLFVIGVARLKDLGNFYTSHKDTFENSLIINVDNSKDNENYGKINLVNLDAPSLSSLIFGKFAEWNYLPNKVGSKSLLIGFGK